MSFGAGLNPCRSCITSCISSVCSIDRRDFITLTIAASTAMPRSWITISWVIVLFLTFDILLLLEYWRRQHHPLVNWNKRIVQLNHVCVKDSWCLFISFLLFSLLQYFCFSEYLLWKSLTSECRYILRNCASKPSLLWIWVKLFSPPSLNKRRMAAWGNDIAITAWFARYCPTN